MKKEKRSADNKVKYGTISLPLPLIVLIKEKIKGTGLPSVSAYVSYILRQVLSYDDKEFSEVTEEDIKKKLKKLGYI
ncbi:CopG family transcriptional regulator [Candidatus Pacearchaeota archaeon]|nr:CopG family transcriptional regulator [Candidatus Pacearchaeota archaeon]